MNREEFKKLAEEEFINNTMKHFDSALIFTYIQNLEQKVNNLQSKIDKAIEYIEENILDNKIEKVNWDYDECYYSDMPADRIKPLIDILKEVENVENN